MKIPNKVIESLKKSGWYSSRNIDISIYDALDTFCESKQPIEV